MPNLDTAIRFNIDRELRSFYKNVALIGLGRLQLGLIAPIFHDLGYNLVGVNLGDPQVVERIRLHDNYRLIDNPPTGGVDVPVTSVYQFKLHESLPEFSAVQEKSLAEVATAEILNFALGTEDASQHLAARVALAIARYRRRNAIICPLYITCSDNPVGTKFGTDLILSRFQSISFILPDDERIAIWNDVSSHIRFLPMLADRICSQRIIDPEPRRPIKIVAEPFGEISVNKAFLAIRPVDNSILKGSRSIIVYDDLEHARQRKLYTISMAHAIVGYTGVFHSKNPRTISDAVRIREIRVRVENALEEIASSFTSRNAESKIEWLNFCSIVLSRIENEAVADPIPRVIRDVPRKLIREDRLFGPLLLILRVNFRLCEPLVDAIVYALLYAFLSAKTADNNVDLPTRTFGKIIAEHGASGALQSIGTLSADDEMDNYILRKIEQKLKALVPELP